MVRIISVVATSGGADAMTALEGQARLRSVPSVDGSLGTKLLPTVLSLTAGSVDVIGFLGLGGLLTAHITGNLVILAAHLVNGGTAPLAPMLAVPIFMLVLGCMRLLVAGLAAIRLGSLRPLLALHFVLLVGFLALSVSAGAAIDPDAPRAMLAGMFGVAAMAVQNALVQLSLKGMPATAVMTTNITRFTMDIGAVLLARDPRDAKIARKRAQRTWPAIIGFSLGCACGAALEAGFGLWSLTLPAGLALVALALAFFVGAPDDGRG
jgi:uncharacterized membrane protein YoaK (UPF0700 family)